MTRATCRVLFALALAGVLGVLGVTDLGTATAASGVMPRDYARRQNFDAVRIETVQVRPNIHMLVGAGGNVTVMTGEDGVLLVDTQVAPMSDRILAAVRALSNKPIRYVVNTHVHPDHIGGNEAIARAGASRAGGNVVGDIGDSARNQAAIVAHENVLKRMSAPQSGPALPFGLWPTETFFGARRDMLFNGEAVQMFHQPAAHTDGDILVFFRRSDVISAGDLFVTTGYPFIDVANGGHINGVIAALNRIIDIAVPSNVQEGGTMIIPGHGRVTDEWEVVEYRDMVTIVRDRIQTMIRRGLTLDQIKAARPTIDYDARFGSDSGFWTTSMFIETIYRNLTQSS
jgi:glyoxylase-like metal-dependent hydrolase (beta-lactamase superfamily II)